MMEVLVILQDRSTNIAVAVNLLQTQSGDSQRYTRNKLDKEDEEEVEDHLVTLNTWILNLEVIHDLGKNWPAKGSKYFKATISWYLKTYQSTNVNWEYKLSADELTMAGGALLPCLCQQLPGPSKSWSGRYMWFGLKWSRIETTAEKHRCVGAFYIQQNCLICINWIKNPTYCHANVNCHVLCKPGQKPLTPLNAESPKELRTVWKICYIIVFKGKKRNLFS